LVEDVGGHPDKAELGRGEVERDAPSEGRIRAADLAAIIAATREVVTPAGIAKARRGQNHQHPGGWNDRADRYFLSAMLLPAGSGIARP